MFCKHKWAVLSEREFDSPIKRLSLTSFKGGDDGVVYGTLVQVVVCEKCGKLKKLVTRI